MFARDSWAFKDFLQRECLLLPLLLDVFSPHATFLEVWSDESI